MNRNIRILVIDDDSVIREQFCAALSRAGYEVFESANGTEGLAVFNQRHPQLVLLDVRLPDMDGREVCQMIKADPAQLGTSVILVSGEATSGHEKAHGLDVGADEYLAKPVSGVELLARVRSILRLRHATEALRASEEYYRRLLEILPDAVLLVSPQGQLLHANPQAIAMLGFSSEIELIQRGVFDLLPADEQARFRSVLGSTLAAEVTRNHQYTLLRKDNQPFPVEISAACLDTFQGHSLALVFVVRDISYRKEAEAALEKSRFLQKAILDNISDPAWLKDAQGRFLLCNEALAAFYGKTVEATVGKTVFDLPMPLQRASELAQEDAFVMSSKRPGRFEGERTNAHGQKRWFESFKTPLFEPDGKCIGIVGIARDTTGHKRLEEELRLLPRRIIEAQEAERLRVARDLHDSVNQLLASVQMRIRRIEEGLTGISPSTREILARCHDQIVAALEENRRIAHDLRPSDLDELGLAVSCRNFCRHFRARTNLNLRYYIKGLSERAPRETELNLFRIVQESLANVEKHARAKSVHLSLSRQNGAVLLKVQDDGRGFNPKVAADPHRSKRGIGLTNMKERAALLKGTCEVRSSPGQGTTVLVRIPIEQDKTQSVT